MKKLIIYKLDEDDSMLVKRINDAFGTMKPFLHRMEEKDRLAIYKSYNKIVHEKRFEYEDWGRFFDDMSSILDIANDLYGDEGASEAVDESFTEAVRANIRAFTEVLEDLADEGADVDLVSSISIPPFIRKEQVDLPA